MKIIHNMTGPKNRFQNFSLDGHTDRIMAMDVRNGIIATASRDSTVKMWDIDRKKGWTFKGHMNDVRQVVLWDDYSALSGGIDRSIRYFDIRDWGNENESFTEDSETLNGYHYSKLFKGHTKSITTLRRLNNSHNRVVSASDDSTVKIWDINANIYSDCYSNSQVKGHKLNENTEVIEPLESLEGDHEGGIRGLAMNQCYLVTFSDEDGCLVVRDWEKINKPLVKIKNFSNLFNLNQVNRGEQGQYNSAGYRIFTMELCQRDQHLLVSTESKRVRIWDLRMPILRSRNQPNNCLQIEDKTNHRLLNTNYCDVKAGKNMITGGFKTVYQSEHKRLVAMFANSMGIHTFDIRKASATSV